MPSWSSLPAVALPACVLSATLLLPPGEASAQRPPKPEGRSLNAAIAEAKRSPFWRAGHAGPLRAADSPVRVGSAPLSHREKSWAGEPNDEPRDLGLATALGIAAGDFIAFSLCDGDDLLAWLSCVGFMSSPVPAAANWIAGAPPGAAFVGSLLGTVLGLSAGAAVTAVLAVPLYIAALIPGAITYYAVRLGVTLATVRHLGRDD